MKVKCYSVRIQCLISISEKAVKISSFNGAKDIFPKSQIFGRDWDVMKSEAYWIAAWILEKKNIQYSVKKEAWFDKDTRKQLPTYKVFKHIPKKITKKAIHDDSLKR